MFYRFKIFSNLIIFLLLLVLNPCFSEENEKKEKELELSSLRTSTKDDFVESLKWAWQGSYKQFEGTQNKVFAAIAILSTAYFIKNDDQISKEAVKKHKNEKLFRFISDSSIFFNTPILPMGFYFWGQSNNDEKMVRFSKEYFATLTLALLETGAISLIPVHQRPDQKELSFWEKAFRGQSSFPSGHVVGYTVLGFKTLQFYGPLLAITPFVLAAATGYERVHSEKHYASDVIASGFISLLASEGVRYASNYNKNHPIYEWIFKHDFSLNYIRKDDIPGINVSFSY